MAILRQYAADIAVTAAVIAGSVVASRGTARKHRATRSSAGSA